MLTKLMKELEDGFSQMKSYEKVHPTKDEDDSQPRLNDSLIFKMVIMLIMCVQRLKAKGN